MNRIMTNRTDTGRRIAMLAGLGLAAAILVACSPYAGVSVGASFGSDGLYLSPHVGVGVSIF
ncbi:hypothetical protein [Oceanomicrobium pacificus]|uniref:Uncharacterized protein n=1 Tax=Oceanomicrobium pacificus TaxID=2692916 RepID=A0A6B0U5Y0_9RHOB|nr:hypothetical protein [Oceanomicrobium pacificus]MXU66301.1 hypothetical protein [Oceanomicrobium pacificus]